MGSNSRTANSIKNILSGFLGQFITTILGFVNRTVFISCLAAEYLGVNGLFTNILSMLSLAELGIGTAIIYALYKPLANKDEKQISKLMNFYSKAYISIGIIIFVLGIALMPFLHIIIKNEPNIVESIYLIYFIYLFNTAISYFFSYKSSLIIADQKNYIVSLIGYGVNIFQTILQIIILYTTKNFLLYLIIQSICVVINNVLISAVADKKYPFIKENKKLKLGKDEVNDLISNVKALVIVKISGILVNNTDNIIISYFSGLKTVGLSSNYTLLINIINTVLNQVFSGITASVGNLNAKEDNKVKKDFFDLLNFCNFWLYGFSSICIVLLINDVIRLWIGDKFILPIEIPIILAINFYMVGMQNAVWTYKNTMGIFKQGRYILFFTAAINLVLSIYLGDKMGLFGILLATAIARLFTNTWMDPYVVYKYGLNSNPLEYLLKYIKYIIVLILTGSFTAFLTDLVHFNIYITFIIKFIICVFVPNIVFLILFFRKKEFKYLLYKLKNVILKFYKCTDL